jgi:hypothetical protein
MMDVSGQLNAPKVSPVDFSPSLQILDQIDIELEHLSDADDQFVFWD